MTTILLLIFALVCCALIAWGMRGKGRFYEFPFLAGGTFVGFILPQLIGLQHNDSLPDDDAQKAQIEPLSFNPLRLVPGIEPSNDEILAARREIYKLAADERGALGCPLDSPAHVPAP